MSKQILLAAGGTGGHMFPAQALAEILKENGWDIALMTDGRGLKHAGKIPADVRVEVEAASISPKHPVRAISGAWKLLRGVKKARKFCKDWHPDVIVGFGGYPSFPALSSAKSLGVPYILHEQNTVLGRVNKIFAKDANWVVSGFDHVTNLPKGANWKALGNPLRKQIVDVSQRAYIPPHGQINLLIVGGSLGAKILSETMPAALELLPQDMRAKLNVVQQTRSESLDYATDIYRAAGIRAHCAPFFEDIATHLANAHYIVARAGASSVSEVMAMGLPALFIPLAIAMDDHQSENAKPLKNLGAADILPESEFTPQAVKTILMERLNDSNWLEQAATKAKSAAKPDAAAALADLVLETAKR